MTSSSHPRFSEKQIVIYYPSGYEGDGVYPLSTIRIPINPLISKNKLHTFCQTLPADKNINHFSLGANTISVTDGRGPALYMFGGFECPEILLTVKGKQHVNKSHRYDLLDLKKIPEKLADMPYGISLSLAAQVGDPYLFVLGFDFNDKFVFQKYILEMNQWHIYDDVDNELIINFDCGKLVRRQIAFAPHVIVGNRFHVSLGDRSFAFDTNTHTWEESNLFDNFWNVNKVVHFPSDFYGGKAWNVTDNILGSGRVRGLPFGFYGRGIVWDKDVLLGVHRAPDCALVAFLLKNDIVVKSQRFNLKQLGLDHGDDRFYMYGPNYLSDGACLVDLGRGGYFGLVHLVYVDTYYSTARPRRFLMELITFKVSRLKSTASDDSFLACKFVRKDFVSGNKFPATTPLNVHAFSVWLGASID